ncbi:MAG TPA: Tat pathway signal sequence domain protein [Phenylobacterium sp.]|uniref:Tat pathway signal sequence domain protein n=1 Tax=Phenylobacterium sp. TaxID=1871053 RepID=UPI002BF9C8F2|nr:Tat pathway signal sequence domain protein [Phenylobacterium sp.]HSV04428.1 Tat pathway signal sequence domain protein [Phenylobacterium sp.]
MRRLLLISFAALIAALPGASFAQYGGGGGPGGGGPGAGGPSGDKDAQDEAKKKKRDKEWGDNQAPLPALRNAGPCPFVKTLYDAARYVDFKEGREASADVGYTGEIQGISSGCAYKENEPIKVAMELLFELGKGPAAQGSSHTYRYWIAVTDRNREVLAKRTFEMPVSFPAGRDRIYKRETINDVTIPRADGNVSGANFEVLVGFDVTPQMAEFNRLGKRFRLSAGATLAAETTPARK